MINTQSPAEPSYFDKNLQGVLCQYLQPGLSGFVGKIDMKRSWLILKPAAGFYTDNFLRSQMTLGENFKTSYLLLCVPEATISFVLKPDKG